MAEERAVAYVAGRAAAGKLEVCLWGEATGWVWRARCFLERQTGISTHRNASSCVYHFFAQGNTILCTNETAQNKQNKTNNNSKQESAADLGDSFILLMEEN